MNTGMYSPKISESLIPDIHRLSQATKMPMTKVVSYILGAVIKRLKDDGLFRDLQEEERAIKGIAEDIARILRLQTRAERKKAIQLLNSFSGKEDDYE